MSGIAGIVSPAEDILQKSVNLCCMSEAIRTRGMTGAGCYISPNAAFLKRTGPFGPSCGGALVSEHLIEGKSYAITMDGTIYNTKELAADLEAAGIRCSSVNISELIIHSFVKWKESFFEKINGSFAFAIWNKEDKTLFLVRDHHGIKPLYYSLIGQTLIFASDIKAITRHPHFKRTIDKEGLSELICLSPRHTPGSGVIKGISQVRPGHFVRFSEEGAKHYRYWVLEDGIHEDDLIETLSTVRELVTDSIKRQMYSDVNLCGFLSGGLYSSLITATVSQNPMLLNNSIYNTWSVDFEKANGFVFSNGYRRDLDLPWIRWVSRKSNTRHHYIILSAEDMIGALFEAEEASGVPGVPDYDTSLLLLCREMKKDFDIALAGDCSDELFGSGYKLGEHFITTKKRLPWTSNLAEKISVFKNDVIDIIKPYEFIEKCYEEALADYTKFSKNGNSLNKEREAQWFSLYWNLPCYLERLDKMSMASGLEVRVPFCDFRLTEYFWKIPQELKRLNNMERGLLREAMRGFLPMDILERRKNPYPRFCDPEYEAQIKGMLHETVLDPGSPIRYLLNIKTLESMMKQPLDLSKKYTTRAHLYGWLIQLNNFLLNYDITPF